MCGIVGIYKKGLINENAIEKFVDMLERCQDRGYDATGVFHSGMRSIKARVPSTSFVRTPKFKEWAFDAIGKLFAIGHCRQATRGNPAVMENNHPIPVIDDEKKVFLVHNGIVKCAKWDTDVNKGKIDLEMTDTYIFANAIRSYIEKNPGVAFSKNVKHAFEDVHLNSEYDSSVIVVADDKEIVICKSSGKPLYIQVVEDGTIIFASEEKILLPGFNVKKDDEMVCSYKEVCDHAIITIDVETGKMKEGFMTTLPRPRPTREIIKYQHGKWKYNYDPVNAVEYFNDKSVKVAIARNASNAGEIIDQYENFITRKKSKRSRKKEKQRGRLVNDEIYRVEDDDASSRRGDESDDIEDDDDDNIFEKCEDKICPRCISCRSEPGSEIDELEVDGYSYCEILGYDVPKNYAKKCVEFHLERIVHS